MSGYEICRTVRAGDGINDPWDPDLPIIMLSAKAEHVDRVRGLQRGADDYVTTLPPCLRGARAGAKCALVLWRGGFPAQEGPSNARARAAGRQ
jgi:PleD family two-component response regulator